MSPHRLYIRSRGSKKLSFLCHPPIHLSTSQPLSLTAKMIAKILLLMLVAVGCACAEEHYGYEGDDSHDHDFEPQPYHFGYHVKDHHGEQHREEASDGHGNVKGSYGFVDEKGIHREVHYVADDKGFRAEVKTNEPGTANQQPASVGFQSNSQDYLHFHEDVPEPHSGYF